MDLEAYVPPVIAFVRDNAAWAPPIVFALAFGESLAFVSLLVPACAALVAIGALIGPSGISFWPAWIAAALGAACGEWLSYWIGLKLEHTVAHIWPLSRHPDLIPKGEAFMKKWGMPRNFHRAVFRTVARGGAPGRRHFRDAVLALSTRQFYLGLRVGGHTAHDRRRHFESAAMIVTLPGEKTPPGFCPGGI
jgi:hypothetical protein